jgi:hypothetical protein
MMGGALRPFADVAHSGGSEYHLTELEIPVINSSEKEAKARVVAECSNTA